MNSDVSIDELLGHGEDEPAAVADEPTGSILGWLLRAAVGAALLAGAAVFVARAFGVGVPYPLAFVGVFAPIALRRVLRAVAPQPLPRVRLPARPEDSGFHWGAMDGLRLAVAGWEIRLDWGTSDLARFARTTQPALAELADERLRQRHGCTMAGDPARARALLGDPLWTLLTTPAQRPLSPRQLSALLDTLEKI